MTSNTKPTTRSTSVIIVYVVLKFVTLARKITPATINKPLKIIDRVAITTICNDVHRKKESSNDDY